MTGSPRTDARTRASVAALDGALAWYLAEAPSAATRPIPVEVARALRDVLDGRAPLDADLFDAFVAFGGVLHRMARLAPGVPACTVGDALAALAALPAPAGEAPWPFDAAVDRETFAKLGFAGTSTGIARSRDNNLAGWSAHAARARAFVERAAARAPRPGLAVVLGVGDGFDAPLGPLARTFERLVLVDVDAAPLEAAAARALAEAPGARVEARALELTGVDRAFVAAIDALLAGPGDADDLRARVQRRARAYRLDAAPALLRAGERADLVVSSCLLTQLAWPLRDYAHAALARRFGALDEVAERSWSRACAELELRVQQDHVAGLLEAGRLVALVSDVVNHLTALDAAGTERLTGRAVPALGVESLVERVPRASAVLDHEQWWWRRYRPGPRGEPGSLMSVEGVVLGDVLGEVEIPDRQSDAARSTS